MIDDTYSTAPIWFTDVIGSGMMIVFSFLAVVYALRLRRLKESDVISTYLVWFCVALAGFAISRGVGHIAKRMLFLADRGDIWLVLRPYSGGINTLAFTVLASVTFFFHRVYRINTSILKDKRALEIAGGEVLRLNKDLQALVQHRTSLLGASEEKYRRIFEGSMDIVFILGRESRFLDINRAGVTALGFEDRNQINEKYGLNAFFISQNDYQAVLDELIRVKYIKDRECRLRSMDGSELHILLSATSKRDENGAIERIEGIAKDITTRIQMERQLQQADKLASLGQISTGIAHEINNPLGVMLGYTQLLLRDHHPGSQIHDDLKTIEKHARNCKTIVEDLLKFPRSAHTKKTCVSVNALLKEVLSLLSHQFELDNINLREDFDPTIPDMTADGEKLKQVFMNLLMNAKQAISNDGMIEVQTTNHTGEYILIKISDTGCGIRPEDLNKIFDPFFTTKPIGEGTGLGLSVSYGIIQDHNGTIEVDSAVGKGSSFNIILPIMVTC